MFRERIWRLLKEIFSQFLPSWGALPEAMHALMSAFMEHTLQSNGVRNRNNEIETRRAGGSCVNKMDG